MSVNNGELMDQLKGSGINELTNSWDETSVLVESPDGVFYEVASAKFEDAHRAVVIRLGDVSD